MKPLPRAGGFTLIEVLAVVTIIAILAGIVVVNVVDSASKRRVQAEAERLALAVELARGEAVRRNETWALKVAESQYEFLRLEPGTGEWGVVEDAALRLHRTESALELVRTRPAGQRRRGAPNDDAGPFAAVRRSRERPDVAIFANGELMPFQVRLTGSGGGAVAWIAHSDGIRRTRAQPAAEVADRRARARR